ncbi:alanine racemase [Aureimonas fodinaquatilis]|uniref:Alanine racemase n=1 Tax=Aureimonas fodinaquatilis TaxID=2565783 RepID=A0A5B0DSK6_9HYPH|nr:alanine racemase [Aureimonas fodinaquatilis]KAA0968992.1 alanine racemase [Aureimonas fodinaquatilis]
MIDSGPSTAVTPGNDAAWRTSPETLASAGLLIVDLAAVRHNYRLLRAQAKGAAVGGVVKADSYGLGAGKIAPVLWDEGCRSFFVAQLCEALALKPILPPEAEIFVLNGVRPGAESLAADAGVIPVLNSLEDIAAWTREGQRRGKPLPAAIQLDSGMSRLGMPPADVDALRQNPELLSGMDLQLIMSHLACADEPDHGANHAQLQAFRALEQAFPAARRSLANSAGIFLGQDWRFDLVRPGIALYGGAPFDHRPNPMSAVVRLETRITQIREVPAGVGIGYGFTRMADAPMRLATLGMGYADGWHRRLAGGAVWFNGKRLPFAGRISMDSIILDATDAPDLQAGDWVEVIGKHQTLEHVAAEAGTISYEVLTSLGHRFSRYFVDGA